MTKFRGGAALLAAALAVLPGRAWAIDAASLQFTVPAPDPAQAGDMVSFQVMAVNAGTNQWNAGSYYWVAEVYDLEYHMIARTDPVTPPTPVPAGGVASGSRPSMSARSCATSHGFPSVARPSITASTPLSFKKPR